MSDKVYVGLNAQTFDSSPSFEPYSKVIVWYDDENAFTSGDDTGRTLEVDIPWATQAIADDILARISGFVYSPFEATSADVDLAAELGDGVTVSGVYAPLATMDIIFGRGVSTDISAPADEEIDHEIAYVSKQERELSRKVTLGKSYYGTRITRANGLEVVTTEADGTETARAMLNSDVLAFYDADGIEALYFDAVAKKYKFRGDVEITGGSINVNDNFIVYEDGSVVINGPLSITGDASFIQVRYSTNKSATIPSGWSETWNDAWSNTSTEVWAIYSYDSGTTWSAPILVQGKNGEQGEQGEQGPAGSSASIPSWVAAYTASAQYNTLVTNEWVVTMNLYGGEIHGSVFYGQEFNIHAGVDSGAVNLYGTYGANEYNFFQIYYFIDEVLPSVRLDSPNDGQIIIGNSKNYSSVVVESTTNVYAQMRFHDTVDFSGATVTGLSVVFG